MRFLQAYKGYKNFFKEIRVLVLTFGALTPLFPSGRADAEGRAAEILPSALNVCSALTPGVLRRDPAARRSRR